MVSRSSSSVSPPRTNPDPPNPPHQGALVEARGTNRLKDDFLACISHELRTPLTAILGMATLLQESSVGNLSDRQRHYTQVIHRSGQHLMAIVNDILDLTRLESGQMTLNYQPIQIAQVCQEAFEQAQKLTGFQHGTQTFCQRFDLTVEPGLSTLVADGDRLRQMLAHLLSNALKFTDESSGPMGLKVGQWEGWIAFTVWDRGIGIPNDKQHLLFQRFQQLEDPMTRQFEGTGLGLVLTQRLAHLHGGDVTFTSQEHQGSQFTLLLPPQPPQVLTAPTHAPSCSVSGAGQGGPPNRLVLLVEGNLQALEDGVEQLTALGYRVTIARSGLEALEKARTLNPCLILLNPHLPLLSGWDVLRLLKGDPATAELPIVMTLPPGESIQSGPADHFLTLPLSPDRLAHTLDHMIHPPQVKPPISNGKARSVVLCLSPPSGSDSLLPLPELLKDHRHRLIEAHDLDQAELLARVWQPQVVVLNCPMPEAQVYLDGYAQKSCLANLPLITLDSPTTHLANQHPQLAVFPCLSQEANPDRLAATLEAAMVIAITFCDRPLVVAVNLAQLGQDRPGRDSPWLGALTQYLQAAHLRVSVAHELAELEKILQTETVHLLLLYWEGDQQGILDSLDWLSDRASLPTLLLNPQDHALPKGLPKDLQRVPPQQSMEDLLKQIHQHLGTPQADPAAQTKAALL
jgi:CheY-like chemotaxis protein